MGKLRQIGKLYALYARMDLRWFLQDLKNCLIVIISELVVAVSQVAGVLLLSQRFSGIGGFTPTEVLWMLGFYMLADGALYMFFGGSNVHQISRRVGRGQLDHCLIQPLPLWMQLLTEGFIPASGGGPLLVGLCVTAYATRALSIAVTPLWIGMLAVLAFAHVAIEMGASYLIATGAFYKPVACEEISSVAHELLATLGRYPLFGLPEALLWALFTVLPAGLMAFFPSLILLGKTPKFHVFLPIFVATALCLTATALFRKGLRHYVKTGSSRYRDMGHR